jgi:hypothetical protein
MRLQVSDDEHLNDLIAFMRSVGCVAYAIDGNRLHVVVPDSLTERAARLRLAAYLDAWRRRRRGAEVAVLDD